MRGAAIFGRFLRGAALGAGLALAAPPAAAEAVATAVVVQPRDRGAVVSLRFSPPFRAAEPPRAFTLADPPRVVVDLPATVWRIDARPAPAGLVAGLRWGVGAPGRGRLVVDLTGPAAVAGLRLAPEPDGGALLTLGLRATGADAFAAGAGWPEGLAPTPPADAAPAVIAIDAGHGGADPGAVKGGVAEKDVTLAFAEALAAALAAEGLTPLLTRGGDVFVGLAARVGAARAAGADALVSIHADAAPQAGLGGASVYVLSEDGADALAESLAAAEGAGEAALPGVEADVAAALADMALRDVGGASERLGAALVGALGSVGPVLPSRPLRGAAFRVLRAPDLPAALVELGFLSNAADRARLVDPAWRARAARAMAAALADWARVERGAEIAAPGAAP